MTLSIRAVRAQVFAALSADPHFAEYTQRKSQFMAIDAAGLPAVEVSLYRVPASFVAHDGIQRDPELQIHILRSGVSGVVEDDLGDDAVVAEKIGLSVLSGLPGVVAYDVGGWDFIPSTVGSLAMMRAVVRVTAKLSELHTD